MIAVKVVNGGKNHRFGGREKERERGREMGRRVQKVAEGAVDGSLAALCRSEKRGVGG